MDLSEIDDLLAKARLKKNLTAWEDTALCALSRRRKTQGERVVLTGWQQDLLVRLAQ